jgi:hypothetical protein
MDIGPYPKEAISNSRPILDDDEKGQKPVKKRHLHPIRPRTAQAPGNKNSFQAQPDSVEHSLGMVA